MEPMKKPLGQKIKDALTPGRHAHDSQERVVGYADTQGVGTALPGGLAADRTTPMYEGVDRTTPMYEGGLQSGLAGATQSTGMIQSTAATAATELRTGEEVCNQRTFVEVEDRPVMKERVERFVEHRPVEKQYVTETRFVGEREVAITGTERVTPVDVTEYEVARAAPGSTCPSGVACGLGDANRRGGVIDDDSVAMRTDRTL